MGWLQLNYDNTLDADGDGIPNWLEDDDADGTPNFLDPDNAFYADADNDGLVDLLDTDNTSGRPFGTIGLVDGSILPYPTDNLTSTAQSDWRDKSTVAPLPVELTYFDATKVGTTSLLSWETASEENNDRFEIERSANNVDWEKIGEVAGAGNSQQLLDYTWIDEKPIMGTNYYRLKQVDYNGEFSYSEIRTIDFIGISKVTAYPNPTRGMVKVSLEGDISGDLEVVLTDVFGKEHYTATILKTDYLQQGLQLDLGAFRHGYYFLKVSAGKQVSVVKVLVQN